MTDIETAESKQSRARIADLEEALLISTGLLSAAAQRLRNSGSFEQAKVLNEQANVNIDVIARHATPKATGAAS